MAIEFTDVSLRILGRYTIEVTWEIVDETAYSEYEFWIERSEHPRDPDRWYRASANIAGANLYLDDKVNRSGKWFVFYYRVGAKNIATGEECYSDEWINPEDSTNAPNETLDDCAIESRYCNPAFEIVRRGNEILNNGYLGIGRAALIYTKINQIEHGCRCPRCYDTVSGRRYIKECSYCNNTGYVDGYYKPIYASVSFSPRVENTNLMPTEKYTKDDQAGYMMNVPLIKPEDLIYDISNGELWRVQWVKKNSNVIITYQDFNLVQINRGDIMYKRAKNDYISKCYIDVRENEDILGPVADDSIRRTILP